MRQKPSVTTQDVAKAAGVSVSTVSRALNDKDDVAAATYANVQRTVKELEYTSNLAARSLRSRKTDTIGLVALDLKYPFTIQVMLGVNQAIQTFGYDLILYASGNRADETRAAWEPRHVSLISGSVADGVIIITLAAVTFPTTSPVVAVDPHSGNTDCPTVFAAHDESAIGTIETAREAGLRVPEDLSVAGFDDISEASIITPTLTTIEQPMRKMGYIATEMLVSLIEGKKVTSSVHETAIRLIFRDSCGGIQ